MKKKAILIILFLTMMIPLYTNAIIEKSPKEYITDGADLLTDDAEDYIVQYSDFLYKEKKIDYYVVTVKNLEEETLEDYSEKIYESYNINKKGILVLVAKEERKMRIEVGIGLGNDFEENQIDEYIDTYFIPYMEQGKWNEGIINGYSAIYKYICEQYGIDASAMEVSDNVGFLLKYKTPIIFVMVWLCVTFANIFSKFYQKAERNKKKIENKETIKIGILLVINILILSFSYLVEPIYILFLIGFEGITLYSNLSSMKKEKVPQTRRKRKTKPKNSRKY